MSSVFWKPHLQSTDVEIKESNLVYPGFFQISRYTLRHRCFSGDWSAWLDREQVRRADAAAVLLFDPVLDKLVLVEQFRMGVFDQEEQSQSPWMLEIVAGLIDAHERPEETIRREAQEEADCVISQLHTIGEFYNSPGGFAEKTTLFLGKIDANHVNGVHGVGTEHEDILVHVLETQAVLDAFEKGDFVTSASTVIALQWFAYQRHRQSLPDGFK